MDLWALSEALIRRKSESLKGVVFFTALAHWKPNKVARHRTYIRALEHRGVEVVYGEFKRVTRRCRLCLKKYPTFEEKETDVNIALRLLKLATENRYDKALLVSADSDLIPALRTVRTSFPAKEITAVIPVASHAMAMKQEADSYMRIKEKHLKSCQLPNPLSLPDGSKLVRPSTWI